MIKQFEEFIMKHSSTFSVEALQDVWYLWEIMGGDNDNKELPMTDREQYLEVCSRA